MVAEKGAFAGVEGGDGVHLNGDEIVVFLRWTLLERAIRCFGKPAEGILDNTLAMVDDDERQSGVSVSATTYPQVVASIRQTPSLGINFSTLFGFTVCMGRSFAFG